MTTKFTFRKRRTSANRAVDRCSITQVIELTRNWPARVARGIDAVAERGRAVSRRNYPVQTDGVWAGISFFGWRGVDHSPALGRRRCGIENCIPVGFPPSSGQGATFITRRETPCSRREEMVAPWAGMSPSRWPSIHRRLNRFSAISRFSTLVVMSRSLDVFLGAPGARVSEPGRFPAPRPTSGDLCLPATRRPIRAPF